MNSEPGKVQQAAQMDPAFEGERSEEERQSPRNVGAKVVGRENNLEDTAENDEKRRGA